MLFAHMIWGFLGPVLIRKAARQDIRLGGIVLFGDRHFQNKATGPPIAVGKIA